MDVQVEESAGALGRGGGGGSVGAPCPVAVHICCPTAHAW